MVHWISGMIVEKRSITKHILIKSFHYKDTEYFLQASGTKCITYKWKRIILELVQHIKPKMNGLISIDK